MQQLIVDCLNVDYHPRFLETERGFQGAFIGHLQCRLREHGLPSTAVAEQEYQKRVRDHGLTIRPDIIVHVPALLGQSRRRDNFLAIQLKLAGSLEDAVEDFDKIDAMFRALDYAEGVFINLASSNTYASHYAGLHRNRLHFYALRITGDVRELRYAHWDGEVLHERML